jgi:hypothetical protein
MHATSLTVMLRGALRLDPQHIGSVMDVKTKDQRTRNAASERVEIADRACAEHGLKCCPHGIVPCLGYHSKFVHDSSER